MRSLKKLREHVELSLLFGFCAIAVVWLLVWVAAPIFWARDLMRSKPLRDPWGEFVRWLNEEPRRR